VKKLASSHSRERVELFEEQFEEYKAGIGQRTWFEHIGGNPVKVWEFFQEIHLTGVEPQYIGKARKV
jgi:hypothetical protein